MTNISKRVSKKQWLERALKILNNHGVSGVKVGVLANQLSTSRSGFYWHFKDRQDLLNTLLKYWEQEYTNIASEIPAILESSPEQRLLNLMLLIQKRKLADYDLAMRSWAEHDKSAAKIVNRVYQFRLDFVEKLFKEIGFKGYQLEMRAKLFVCYHSWEQTMFGHVSDKKQIQLIKLRHKLLVEKK